MKIEQKMEKNVENLIEKSPKKLKVSIKKQKSITKFNAHKARVMYLGR
jgi:hypothetical protein